MRIRFPRFSLVQLFLACLCAAAVMSAWRRGLDVGFRQGQEEVNGRGLPFNAVYDVPFLVVEATGRDDFADFNKIVHESVQPQSWEMNGGEGRIEHLPTNQSIVVWNHRAAHRQIGRLIDQLAQLDKQEKQAGRRGWIDSFRR